MAFNGMVSVVKNGKVVLKIAAGCDGHNAKKLAKRVNENTTPEQARQLAARCGFGCEDCLVIQASDDDIFDRNDDLSPLYREKFNDPRFSPSRGYCEHVYVVSESGIESPKDRKKPTC